MLSPYQVLPSAGASFPKGRKHIKVLFVRAFGRGLALQYLMLLAPAASLRAHCTLTELKTVRGDQNFGTH